MIFLRFPRHLVLLLMRSMSNNSYTREFKLKAVELYAFGELRVV